MKLRIRKSTSWLFLLLMSILFMGIGYATINSITGEIKGEVIATVQSGVFITNVEYIKDIDANLNTSNIVYYKGTMMQSLIELSDINPNSEIEYKVTVYNNSENTYPFVGVLYDEEFYDNPDINFEISGFNMGETIGAKETKEIYITFRYKNGVLPERTALSSYINFKIAEPNRLVLANSVAATGKYLTGTITKEKIETIEFKLGKEQPEGTAEIFDASEKQDESIIGYYTDTDGNNLYELTFASDEVIATNKNAQYLFQNLTNLTSIEFNNFSTYGVTGMQQMFYNCSGLTTVNLSNFNTTNVIDMQSMFGNCSGLTTLDVSKFDTSNVTTMQNMFSSCSGLTTLDVNNFNTSKVTTMQNMFYGCSDLTTIYVSEFNSETNTGWTTSAVTNSGNMFSNCTKIVGGNGTTFNSSYTDKTYAVIDKTGTPGYLTNIKDKP